MIEANLIKEVKEKMQNILDMKSAEFERLNSLETKAREKLKAAEIILAQATESMNEEEYEKAHADRAKCNADLELYSSRRSFLEKKKYITESESNKVIESILDYEAAQTADFKAVLSEKLKDLYDFISEYQSAIDEAENAILAWGKNVFPNYIMRNGTIRYDEATGEHTNRSASPVPVRNREYHGCKESSELKYYLEENSKFWSAAKTDN